MNAYFYDKFNAEMGTNVIQYSTRDGRDCADVFGEQFDKVICDVPNYEDRLVLFKDEDSLFKNKHKKERFRLPEVQAQLLK